MNSNLLLGSLLGLFVLIALCPPLSVAGGSSELKEKWVSIREGLKQNKQEMCAFLLNDDFDGASKLTLDKVTGLFEQALDHIGRAVSYISKIRSHLDPKVVANFDRSGSLLVLDVSELRNQLIARHSSLVSNKAKDEAIQRLLEEYFYKACTKKLGTITTEKAMFDALKAVERSLRPKNEPVDSITSDI